MKIIKIMTIMLFIGVFTSNIYAQKAKESATKTKEVAQQTQQAINNTLNILQKIATEFNGLQSSIIHSENRQQILVHYNKLLADVQALKENLTEALRKSSETSNQATNTHAAITELYTLIEHAKKGNNKGLIEFQSF